MGKFKSVTQQIQASDRFKRSVSQKTSCPFSHSTSSSQWKTHDNHYALSWMTKLPEGSKIYPADCSLSISRYIYITLKWLIQIPIPNNWLWHMVHTVFAFLYIILYWYWLPRCAPLWCVKGNTTPSCRVPVVETIETQFHFGFSENHWTKMSPVKIGRVFSLSPSCSEPFGISC